MTTSSGPATQVLQGDAQRLRVLNQRPGEVAQNGAGVGRDHRPSQMRVHRVDEVAQVVFCRLQVEASEPPIAGREILLGLFLAALGGFDATAQRAAPHTEIGVVDRHQEGCEAAVE